jgi:hypothetical protein
VTTSCNWSRCGATENLRLYAGGKRCPSHTPAALKGVPEPHELVAKVNANRPATTTDTCGICGQPMNHIYRDDGAHPWCADPDQF